MFYLKWRSTFVSKDIPVADFIGTNPKAYLLYTPLHVISTWEYLNLVFT